MTEPSLPPFTSLDDTSGPALPLSEAEASARADRIVELATKRPRRRAALWMILAAALAGGTALAWWSSDFKRADQTSHARPPSSALPAPAPVPETTLRVPAPVAAPEAARDGGLQQAPVTTVRDLLELANRARTEHRFERAEALYRSAAKRFPGSDDAYAALVAAADLDREHLSNPRVAARLYRQALSLRARGALHEQALVGLALSAEMLRDEETERAAWSELVAKYPASLQRSHADARLSALAAPP